MKKHEVKILPKFFAEVMSGNKTAEIRKNDRDYKVGDNLILKEYDKGNGGYTGRWIPFKITNVLTSDEFAGLSKGYVMLSLKRIYIKQTNYEKIKNMDIDEMALLIMCPAEYDLDFNKSCDCNGELSRNCYECSKRWLESECEND